MAQKQGNTSTSSGRIGAEVGTAVAAANFALGVGWGTTASVAVTAGSNDQAGQIVVTSAGTGQAQATADVTLTFVDGAYASIPRTAIVTLAVSTQGVAEPQPTAVAVTATTLALRAGALPVATKTYTYNYLVVA